MNYTDGRWEVELGVNPDGTWSGGFYDTYAAAEAEAAAHGHPEAFVQMYNAS